MASTNLRKHTSANPIQRLMIGRFMEAASGVLAGVGVSRALEVGCGEGFLIRHLRDRHPGWQWKGVDIDGEAIGYARRSLPGVTLATGDIYALAEPDGSYDLVVASEVLEHLARPEDGLRELVRVTGRYLLLSVPHEPWFRLANLGRGKYLSRLGNHPEHVQSWGAAAFRSFVSRQATIIRTAGSFPWTIVLAEKWK
ncbi:MAG: class I SAM-dependent methyltransferase [Candidatus Edwardsbacteria bacterium]|jgi:2-polyprenyl-3-methyl-5-hydroxy-6-metoxy-1,4-benzoquinol methylase|nr:class I SAM-dependent methyltransferase [Candidatus Edwardsbacteria bacterium]